MELWLPPRYTAEGPYPAPRDEREELLQRLHKLRVMVPGARDLELPELRDLVQWQEERRSHDLKKAALRPANRQGKLPRDQVIIGIKELLAYRKRREEGLRRHYLSAAGYKDAVESN